MPTTQTHAIEIAAARAQWHPQGAYLNTASYGLPPDCGWEAMQAALADWRAGRTSWEHWGEATNGARDEFAALVRVAPETVATAATVSDLIGLVAASLPDGTRVLAPDIDFASVLFPFMAQEHRGVTMRLVAPEDIPDAIDARTDVVAASAVQMATGEVADLDAIAEAAAAHGAMTVIDATQALGWLPLDASRFDVVACHAYKWLMSPRGTAFMTVRPERLEAIVPAARGLVRRRGRPRARTSARRCASPRPRAASTARRRGSRGWAPSPRWRSSTRSASRRSTPTTSAWRTASARASGSSRPTRAIVSADVPGARERLEKAGIVAAERGGRLRASWHVYNTEADVDAALDALAGA